MSSTISIILIAAQSIAGQQVGTTFDNKPIVKVTEYVVEDSSEHHRQSNKWSMSLESGYGIGSMATTGISGGKFINPNNSLEISRVEGNTGVSFYSMTGSLTEIRWKRWLGNSFYANLGGGIRHLRSSFDGSKSVFTRFGVSAAVGNQWQFDRLTLGCDWFGLFVPLLAVGPNESSDNTAADSARTREFFRQDSQIADKVSSQLLRFYVGTVF